MNRGPVFAAHLNPPNTEESLSLRLYHFRCPILNGRLHRCIRERKYTNDDRCSHAFRMRNENATILLQRSGYALPYKQSPFPDEQHLSRINCQISRQGTKHIFSCVLTTLQQMKSVQQKCKTNHIDITLPRPLYCRQSCSVDGGNWHENLTIAGRMIL